MFESKLDVKILRLLNQYPNGLNVTKIVEDTSTTSDYANKALRRLADAGFVVESKYGRIRVFKLNETNPTLRKVLDVILLFDVGGNKNVET